VAQKGMDKHPYFGYGIENYNVVFQDYFNPKILDSKNEYEGYPDHSHNIYFDTGVAGGYPAIFLYGIFILSIFYGIYKGNKSGLISSVQASVLWGLLAGYIFQNLFVFDSMLSIMILFVFTGIVFALGENYIKEKNTKTFVSLPVKNTIGFLSFAICVPCLIFFVIMPISKSVKYGNLIGMTIDIRPGYYDKLLKGSSVGNPVDISSIADTIYKYYASNLMQIKNDKSLAPYVDGDIKALTAYLDKVIDKNKDKNDYRLYISDALLYNTEITLTDKPYDEVLANHLFSLLDSAYKLSPTNPETFWAKANIYAWQGDLKDAENAYMSAIEIDPSAPGSYRLLANFAKVTGNQKLYDETLAEAGKNISGFKL
jgi:tetratricopeptide (TPR) repeat protein